MHLNIDYPTYRLSEISTSFLKQQIILIYPITYLTSKVASSLIIIQFQII